MTWGPREVLAWLPGVWPSLWFSPWSLQARSPSMADLRAPGTAGCPQLPPAAPGLAHETRCHCVSSQLLPPLLGSAASDETG